MSNKIYLENSVDIQNPLDDNEYSKIEDSIKSVGFKIEAARSGRINGNLVLYTPKAMRVGVETFTYPFSKHLQSKHYGDAVGVISKSEYNPEFFPQASRDFVKLVNKIDEYSEASDGPNLVKAIKELINTKEYKDESFRGLGIANIYGDIYDPETIYSLKHDKASKGKVSIGGKSSEVYCSICGNRVHSDTHEHQKGMTYDGELCFYIHNDLYLDHCGFVTVPADKFTHTELVSDEQNTSLKMSVINYNENSMENLMNLEELKRIAKDADAVKVLIKEQFPEEDKAQLASTKYESALKGSRNSSYLLTGDKVLNLRTPVGIKVAEHLVSKFSDEDTDKEALKHVIENAKTTLKIEDLDKALEEFLVDEDKASKKTQENSQKTDESEPTVEDNSVKVSDEDSLLSKISSLIEEKLSVVVNALQTKVQDNQKHSLAQELTSLRANLEADEKVIESLNKEYSDSLIELITASKGGTISDAYREKLSKRSVSELKQTLEDLKESLEVAKTNREAQPLAPTTQTEAIKEAEDKVEETGAVVEDTPTDDKDEPQDKTKEDEDVKVEDETQDPSKWFAQRVSEVGMATASKEFKIKFGK